MASAVGWLLLWASLEVAFGSPTKSGAGSVRFVARDFEGDGYEIVELDIGDRGAVRGFVKETHSNKHKVNCFLGIPYVVQPKRFEPPSDFYGPWTEIREARIRARSCPQGKFYPDELFAEEETLAEAWGWGTMDSSDKEKAYNKVRNEYISEKDDGNSVGDDARDGDEDEDEVVVEPDEVLEDCLTLDIYTPADAKLGDGLPVLFFIHGGAFVRGSSISARPDFILDHGMKFVIVSIQYRLGALGFLSAGGNLDAGVGNAGLHDQLWALKWTAEYIRYFGGDPDHIVVGGVSAGGATSGLLYVSPETNGYLAGALLFSGCSVSPWTIDLEPRRSARGLAQHTVCAPQAKAAGEAEEKEHSGTGDRETTLLAEDELVRCMQNEVGLEDLLEATWEWAKAEKKDKRLGMGTTIPVLDGVLLPQMPADIMRTDEFRALPIVVGITREEGYYLEVQIRGFYLNQNSLMEDKKLLTEGMGDLILQFAGVDDPLHILGTGMQQLYFYEDQLGNYDLMDDGVIDMAGAAFFKGPALRMVQLNLQKGEDTWLYSFDYISAHEQSEALREGRKPRANHGADQSFIFPHRNESVVYSDEDRDMVERFSRMVATFVTTLKPTPGNEITVEGAEWPPLTEDNEDIYLSIGHNGWHTKRGFTQEYHATNKPSNAVALSAVPTAFAAVFAAVTSLLSRSRF